MGTETVARLVLVRHGHPRGGYGDDYDPGLDDVGRAQAGAMADALAGLGRRPLLVSPLRRTRETAAPLEARWETVARVESRVGEIPSPTDDLRERTVWLRSVLASTWAELPSGLHEWRDALLDTLRGIGEDAVVVTHYVAINAAVGAATGNPRLISCAPDYCSRTVVDVSADGFRLVELGEQAVTRVR
ncbi:MAG TPA: histidine phosphatase family protein [Acidimicrobiia bacterium]